MDKLDALVKDLTGGDVGKVTAAAKSIVALAEDENNQKKLFDYNGIVSGLLEVVKKEGGAYKEAREKAVGAIHKISCADVEKGMFELPGLMKSLLEVLGKEGEEYKVAREKALAAIFNISFGGADVKKGMFELDGLMKSLLEVVKKEDGTHKEAREKALGAIMSISCGGADVQKGMFELDGLMKSLLEVVGKEGEEYKVAREKALGAIMNIAGGGADVKKGMFELDGLMNSLLEVVGKEGEEYKVAREKALIAIVNISCADVEKEMFELDGLMKSLLEVVGKEGEEYKVARENALIVIKNIAGGGTDVKKGMFELDGLMKSLLEVVGKEGEEYKVAREKALGAIVNISCGGAYVQKGMFELDGLMKSLLEVVGKEGEEYKVAREKALKAIVNIADGAEVQFGLATFPSLLPTLLQYATKDSPSPECRRQSVWALSKIAQNPSTAPLLLTPKDSTVDILACVMEIIKEAGEDLEKWERGNSIEFWSLTFLMNVAQAEFAVPYLRVAGVTKVLAPLVKQKQYESLTAAATVAYLVGGDEEGELFDLLSDNKHAIDRIVELLDNTLNLNGCSSYGYGKFIPAPSPHPSLSHPDSPIPIPPQASFLSTPPSEPLRSSPSLTTSRIICSLRIVLPFFTGLSLSSSPIQTLEWPAEVLLIPSLLLSQSKLSTNSPTPPPLPQHPPSTSSPRKSTPILALSLISSPPTKTAPPSRVPKNTPPQLPPLLPSLTGFLCWPTKSK